MSARYFIKWQRVSTPLVCVRKRKSSSKRSHWIPFSSAFFLSFSFCCVCVCWEFVFIARGVERNGFTTANLVGRPWKRESCCWCQESQETTAVPSAVTKVGTRSTRGFYSSCVCVCCFGSFSQSKVRIFLSIWFTRFCLFSSTCCQ